MPLFTHLSLRLIRPRLDKRFFISPKPFNFSLSCKGDIEGRTRSKATPFLRLRLASSGVFGGGLGKGALLLLLALV